jgi:sugar/nucleoside kinase (ribokinase family)
MLKTFSYYRYTHVKGIRMEYDIIMLGHISKDIIIDEKGQETRLYGGALLYSSISAARSGARVLAITKAAAEDFRALDAAKTEKNIDLISIESPSSTSILNKFLSADHERRETTLLSSAEPFSAADIPAGAKAKIIDLAGLFVGELPDSLIADLAGRAEIAADAQGLLREAQLDRRMLFRDWRNKARYMPQVRYFKADAAEAEILTGHTDREKAARTIAAWGHNASGREPEVMVTHNTEVIALVDGVVYRAPFTPSNLSGRTGRGDTTFAAYLAWRLAHDPEESVRFAAALCSIKMEKPGPFSGTLGEVFARMERDASR